LALAAFVVAIGVAQSRRVSDGVFTAAQAERGHVAFERACAGCHSSDLRGDEPREVPPLVREQFDMSWRGEPVAALHRKVRTTMPADRPGALSSAEYTDIVAYILQINGFRPGDRELTADAAALDAITIDPLERTP
jgi:mono/diheme cytochrome c family protein